MEILLKAFERAAKSVEYFALDLSLSELERTFSEILTGTYHHVKCYALHGTYDDAIVWLEKPENQTRPLCVLFLGSSLGNFTREGAARFLTCFVSKLKSSDYMLIGLDACQDPDKVHRAYNDSKGLTRQFYLNGLSHANRLFGYDAFKKGEWGIVGRYDELIGRHEAFYCPTTDISLDRISFRKGELVKLEDAYKYSKVQSDALWHAAGLSQMAAFGNQEDDYSMLPTSPMHCCLLLLVCTSPEFLARRLVHLTHLASLFPAHLFLELQLTRPSNNRRSYALTSQDNVPGRARSICLSTSTDCCRLARTLGLLGHCDTRHDPQG